jgi:hypothetical protein
MRLSVPFYFVVVFLSLILFTTNASSDIRQRFEGLIGKTVQAAWRKIDHEGFFYFIFV